VVVSKQIFLYFHPETLRKIPAILMIIKKWVAEENRSCQNGLEVLGSWGGGMLTYLGSGKFAHHV